MQMFRVCIFMAYTDAWHMDMSGIGMLLSFFIEIRKAIVPVAITQKLRYMLLQGVNRSILNM